MSNLNTVISRVIHCRKNSWMKDKGNLDSHSLSVIYYRTQFISIAFANRVCSLTHAKGKKKTLAHFVPTHSPRTPPQLCTLSSMAVGGGHRSHSKWHWISSPLLSTAYLHRHSRLWSTRVFCGIGPGIFLMEKVINLAKYSLISYRSPSVAVNQLTKIAVESFFVLADSWVFIHVSTVRAQIGQLWSWPVGNEVQSQPTMVGMA